MKTLLVRLSFVLEALKKLSLLEHKANSSLKTLESRPCALDSSVKFTLWIVRLKKGL